MKEVFVFGSNLAGRHGKGSAKEAYIYHGARPGQGVGFCDRSYAIPTKDIFLKVLPLDQIAPHVLTFLAFARAHPSWKFNVVAIGCGLAGYKPEQIAPMFRDSEGTPTNVSLPVEFQVVLRLQGND